MTAQHTSDNLETFVGFWPAYEEYGELTEFALEHGRPTRSTAKQLRASLLCYSGTGWKIIVCADYLCLLHLNKYEADLAAERQNQDIISNNFLSATKTAWPGYLQAVNALYFLLFAATGTGRNHVVLQDFAELSFWNCTRLLYDPNGTPVRHANYGRSTDAYLRRFQLRFFSAPPSFRTIDHGIFSDAARYWDLIFCRGLVPLAALGCKILSEHRLGNYRAALALAWFELEAWVIERAITLGYPTKTTKGKDRRISDIINDFPEGTAIANLRADLNSLRDIRNKIAHQNQQITHPDSSLALRVFVRMLNARSGLALNVHELPTPTIGL